MSSVRIRKTGNSYQVILDQGVGENGKRIRKYESAKTIKEAENIKLKMLYESQVSKVSPVKQNVMTFGEFLYFWQDTYVKQNCEETTALSYQNIINKHIQPNLGHIKLNALTTMHIQLYYKKLLTEFKLSPATVKRQHAIIRKCLDSAKKMKYVTTNEAADVELPKQIEFEGSYYDLNQTKELLRAVKGHEIEVPITLAVYYGMRRSEVLGLRWDNIDFNTREIFIKEVVVRAENNKLIIKAPKTKGSKRKLYMPDAVYELLLEHHQKNQILQTVLKDFNLQYVCTDRSGKPFEPGSLTKRFKVLTKNSKLPSIRFHDLRHSFVSNLYGVVPTKNLASTVGHSDERTTTDVYVHLNSTAEKDVVMTYSNMLK